MKRVIATEGETIDIDFDTWDVTVTDPDGKTRILDESNYRKLATDARVTSDFDFPLTVGKGQLFVMGDNRDNSADSRDWGIVPVGYIHGKAWRFYWSWDSDTNTPRWSRIGGKVE